MNHYSEDHAVIRDGGLLTKEAAGLLQQAINSPYATRTGHTMMSGDLPFPRADLLDKYRKFSNRIKNMHNPSLRVALNSDNFKDVSHLRNFLAFISSGMMKATPRHCVIDAEIADEMTSLGAPEAGIEKQREGSERFFKIYSVRRYDIPGIEIVAKTEEFGYISLGMMDEKSANSLMKHMELAAEKQCGKSVVGALTEKSLKGPKVYLGEDAPLSTRISAHTKIEGIHEILGNITPSLYKDITALSDEVELVDDTGMHPDTFAVKLKGQKMDKNLCERYMEGFKLGNVEQCVEKIEADIAYYEEVIGLMHKHETERSDHVNAYDASDDA